MAKKEKKCCGNCFWFDNEDAYGQAGASIRKVKRPVAVFVVII